MIVAFRQVSGKYFSSQIVLKISSSSVIVSSGRCVRMLLCILSGPEVVWLSLLMVHMISVLVNLLLCVSLSLVVKSVFFLFLVVFDCSECFVVVLGAAIFGYCFCNFVGDLRFSFCRGAVFSGYVLSCFLISSF